MLLKRKMWRFSFRFLISRGNYVKCSNFGCHAPREGTRTNPPYWFTDFSLGTLISNIYLFRVCFSFQDECFECGPIYCILKCRFINFVFQISILWIFISRYSFWVSLNVRILISDFQKCSFLIPNFHTRHFVPPPHFTPILVREAWLEFVIS